MLFVGDDLGWIDLGFMGNIYNSTSNIDKIAEEAIVFTNAYSNASNFAPTRAFLLSGQYPTRNGVSTIKSPERRNLFTGKYLNMAMWSLTTPKKIFQKLRICQLEILKLFVKCCQV
ncbi:MAG: sulfatase-like hydrolase/transferase [Cyclobacteriaceae bacterium]|nr:sulfatase-like hydrolase/transferase [Cyclobacteriaceae bacterium]